MSVQYSMMHLTYQYGQPVTG